MHTVPALSPPFTLLATFTAPPSAANGDERNFMSIGAGLSKKQVVEFRIHRDGLLEYGECRNLPTGAWTSVKASSPYLFDGVQHYVAATRSSAGTVVLFVDGTQVASSSSFPAFPTGLDTRMYTARPPSFHNNGVADAVFLGEIAHLAMASSVLSASEVRDFLPPPSSDGA